MSLPRWHVRHISMQNDIMNFVLRFQGHFMGFDFYIGTLYAVNNLLMVLLWKNVENYGKTFFSGRLRPD